MVLSEQIYIQVNEGRGEKQKFLQINDSVKQQTIGIQTCLLNF